MPGYARAELTAELEVIPDDRAENSPQAQLEAAKQAAGETGLAHEAGPESIVLAGSRDKVLDAAREVIEAALDAGAKTVEIKVEAEDDADRF